MGYSYYDTPDGEDCGKKLLYTTKTAGIYGLGMSSMWVILGETPPTYPLILARYAIITAPCIAAAAAGTISVCSLVDYRKKDDPLNHLYGGFIGGIAGGLAKGNLGHGVAAGILFAGIAASYKFCKMNNINLQHHDLKHNVEDHWTVDYDLRISNQRPKDWIAK